MNQDPGVMLTATDLIIKCLTCKKTYEVDRAIINMVTITDPDPDNGERDFIQYEVTFYDSVDPDDDDVLYLQDLLCRENKCSVFGHLKDSMFAFPFLSKSRGDKWISSPDSKGSHFAMKWSGRVAGPNAQTSGLST